MASDYGDESGEKMLDNFYRFGERMGEAAMRERAGKLHRAFENAKRGAEPRAGAGEPGDAAEFAKLDMAEFKEIEGYDEIKAIIEGKLRDHGVEPAWFTDQSSGKEYLLFAVRDAHEVWESFDELSRESESALEEAATKLKERAAREPGRADREGERGKRGGRPADERPLAERAQQAREAAAALEGERATTRTRGREPRFQETRSK